MFKSIKSANEEVLRLRGVRSDLFKLVHRAQSERNALQSELSACKAALADSQKDLRNALVVITNRDARIDSINEAQEDTAKLWCQRLDERDGLESELTALRAALASSRMGEGIATEFLKNRDMLLESRENTIRGLGESAAEKDAELARLKSESAAQFAVLQRVDAMLQIFGGIQRFIAGEEAK